MNTNNLKLPHWLTVKNQQYPAICFLKRENKVCFPVCALEQKQLINLQMIILTI